LLLLLGFPQVVIPPTSVSIFTIPSSTSSYVGPSAIPAAATAHVKAGPNQALSFNPATTLVVRTSPTSAHADTSVTLLQYDLSAVNAAGLTTVNAAVLQLVVASAPASDMLVLVLAVPAAVCTVMNSVTWSTCGVLKTLADGTIINSISKNFIDWRVQNDGEVAVAGHVTVQAATAAGAVKRLDVTRVVKGVNASQLTFVIARVYRRNAAANTVPVPPDDLSSGAMVGFAGVGHPSLVAPQLRVF
jgi:hypothetical protein